MAKLGRPEKPINWEIFEELCHIQCTGDEIASFLKIGKGTLYDRVSKQYEEDFPTTYKRLSEGGKCSLRRAQFKMAQKNTAMSIWLGKQYLGQKDNQEQNAITPQTIEKFQAVMDQLSALQASSSGKDLKIADNNISNAEKS